MSQTQRSSLIQKLLLFNLIPLKKYFFLFICLNFHFFQSKAQTVNQGYSNNRLLGYNAFVNFPPYLGLQLNSYSGVEVMDSIPLPFQFYSNSANISDDQGNLLFYTNGFHVANAQHQIIPNGDSLGYVFLPGGYGTYFTNYNIWGAPIPQSSVIIPSPGDTNSYTLIYNTIYDTVGWIHQIKPSKYLKIAKVINDSNGEFIITEKDKVLITDTILQGGLAAVKHGNGRDWWIFAQKFSNGKYFKILVTPDSNYVSNGEYPGPPSPGYIDACNIIFSENGKHFVRVVNGNWQGRIYSFDRCTGEFVTVDYDGTISPQSHAGNAYSPSGKYFYFTETQKVWRYNLQAADIPASKELVYTHTGYTDPIFNLPSNYWTMDTPHDGRIYIIGSSSIHRQSWIDYPDTANVADVGFHHYEYVLPRPNNGTNTNHPNYTLGPDLGCPCDTLNIAVKQIDLSKGLSLKVFPNPADELFTISYEALKENLGSLYMYDVMGKEVHRQYLSPWSNTQHIDVSKLPPGVYGVRVFINGKTESTKVIVK